MKKIFWRWKAQGGSFHEGVSDLKDKGGGIIFIGKNEYDHYPCRVKRDEVDIEEATNDRD